MVHFQLNIPMPDCCDDCPFIDDIGDYPYCMVLKENRGYTFDTTKRKFPNCPLKLVEEKNDEVDKLKDICRVLFNRCRAMGSAGGAICMFCGIREECRKMHSI